MGATRVSCTALNAASVPVEPTWYWTSGVTFPDTYVEHAASAAEEEETASAAKGVAAPAE